MKMQKKLNMKYAKSTKGTHVCIAPEVDGWDIIPSIYITRGALPSEAAKTLVSVVGAQFTIEYSE